MNRSKAAALRPAISGAEHQRPPLGADRGVALPAWFPGRDRPASVMASTAMRASRAAELWPEVGAQRPGRR